MIVTGIRDGRPLLRFAATWYCSDVLEQDWDLRATGWHVVVDGDAPLDIDIRFAVPIERMGDASPGYTANRAVNASGLSAPRGRASSPRRRCRRLSPTSASGLTDLCQDDPRPSWPTDRPWERR